MRKFLVGLMFFSFAGAEPVKPYFDLLYPYISKCVREQVENPKPALEIKNKPEIKAYIKAYFGKNGYYVIIDTKKLESKDICYFEFVISKMGYEPVYLRKIEKLVVSRFDRKADAEKVKERVAKKLGIKTTRKVINYFTGEVENYKTKSLRTLFIY